MSQFRRIINFALPYWKELAGLSLLILIMAGLKQVEPFIYKQITDQIASGLGKEASFLPSFIIILLGIFLFVKILAVIFNRLSWYLTTLFAYKLRFSLREAGFAHLMNLPLNFFNSQQSGQLMSKLDRGTTQITQIINNSGMYFFPSLITAIIGFVIVSQFNLWISLGMVLIFIPVGFINYWKFTKNQKLEKREYQLYDKQYGHFWETISAITLIKSFIAEAFELRRLKSFHQRILNIRGRAEKNHNLFTIADILLESWIWFIYAWIVFLTYQGKFSLGTMVLMMSYVQIIRDPLWTLNWMFWEAKRSQIGSRDYFKILDEKSNILPSKKPIKPEQIKGRIQFDKVSFQYEDSTKVLSKVNFNIPPGSSCAFVGKSGAGKTTIVGLINRFYDTNQGRILIDGINIRNFDLKSLRRRIGLVSQEAYLFAASIEENLRYGNPKASLRQMKLACQVANAHEFIKKLPQGYKTLIGERGVKLSGGQRQRLSLARVILKDPPIIIFDEATSQLDSKSEVLIQQALEKTIKGRTTIIIAHRLSTVKKADKIIVLENQKILEQGTHKELLKNKKLYASLFSIQAGQTGLLREWDLET